MSDDRRDLFLVPLETLAETRLDQQGRYWYWWCAWLPTNCRDQGRANTEVEARAAAIDHLIKDHGVRRA